MSIPSDSAPPTGCPRAATAAALLSTIAAASRVRSRSRAGSAVGPVGEGATCVAPKPAVAVVGANRVCSRCLKAILTAAVVGSVVGAETCITGAGAETLKAGRCMEEVA
jgi:hypothetical protein